MNKPQKGDTVWNKNGEKFQYIGPWLESPDKLSACYKVLVLGTWDGDEEEVISGEIAIVATASLYPTEPVYAHSAAIKEQQAILAQVRAATNEAKVEYRKARDQYNKAMEQFKVVDQLQRLDDFLAGRITHYVVMSDWSPPEILEAHFEETTERRAEVGAKELRLLSLYGDTKGDLSWRVNRYKDDNGAWTVVQPCTSLEEAQEFARQRFATYFAEVLADPRRDVPTSWIKAAFAASYGQEIEVSPEVRASARAYAAKRLKEKKAEVERVTMSYEKMEQELAKLTEMPHD